MVCIFQGKTWKLDEKYVEGYIFLVFFFILSKLSIKIFPIVFKSETFYKTKTFCQKKIRYVKKNFNL